MEFDSQTKKDLRFLAYEDDANSWGYWFRTQMQALIYNPEAQAIADRYGGKLFLMAQLQKMLDPAAKLREFALAYMKENDLPDESWYFNFVNGKEAVWESSPSSPPPPPGPSPAGATATKRKSKRTNGQSRQPNRSNSGQGLLLGTKR